MSDAIDERLAREPAEVECPICRHRNHLSAAAAGCGQCGSEIVVLPDRAAAGERLAALAAAGRVGYLKEIRRPPSAVGLWAVIANRRFGGPTA